MPETLEQRYDDVRKLVCAHPAFRQAVASGVDADDLLQEVLLRVHSRWSKWNPERGGLSKWVWLVTRTSVWNYRRALAALARREAADLDVAPLALAPRLPRPRSTRVLRVPGGRVGRHDAQPAHVDEYGGAERMEGHGG